MQSMVVFSAANVTCCVGWLIHAYCMQVKPRAFPLRQYPTHLSWGWCGHRTNRADFNDWNILILFLFALKVCISRPRPVGAVILVVQVSLETF